MVGSIVEQTEETQNQTVIEGINTTGHSGLNDTQHQTRVKTIDPLGQPTNITKKGATVRQPGPSMTQHQTLIKHFFFLSFFFSKF